MTFFLVPVKSIASVGAISWVLVLLPKKTQKKKKLLYFSFSSIFTNSVAFRINNFRGFSLPFLFPKILRWFAGLCSFFHSFTCIEKLKTKKKKSLAFRNSIWFVTSYSMWMYSEYSALMTFQVFHKCFYIYLRKSSLTSITIKMCSALIMNNYTINYKQKKKLFCLSICLSVCLFIYT